MVTKRWIQIIRKAVNTRPNQYWLRQSPQKLKICLTSYPLISHEIILQIPCIHHPDVHPMALHQCSLWLRSNDNGNGAPANSYSGSPYSHGVLS